MSVSDVMHGLLMTVRKSEKPRLRSLANAIDKPLLLIEDSRSIATMLKAQIENKWHCEVHIAFNYEEAVNRLRAHRNEYFIAICDLNLPDAPNGEIMHLIKRTRLPAIVITGSEKSANKLKSDYSQIFDFILKSQPNSVGYLVEQVGRFYYNKHTTLLIVDDSRLSREVISQVLISQNFKVLSADCGQEALEIIEKHPEIKLVVSDYVMPKMNGVELTVELRKKYDKSQLAIIGLSSDNEPRLGLEFIRNGANDFLTKPFITEELSLRINQNLDNIRYIEVIENIAHRDYLTNLHNRRYFYHNGLTILDQANFDDVQLSAALFDIDHFKKINDTYGHDIGDKVLVQFAEILNDIFADDLIARIGGEEFTALILGPVSEVYERLETFRETLAATPFVFDGNILKVTASIGCNTEKEPTLDAMLIVADNYLYQAKQSGRNRVLGNFD